MNMWLKVFLLPLFFSCSDKIKRTVSLSLLMGTLVSINVSANNPPKLKLAIDGLTHQHVVTFFRSNAVDYFDLVGIAESDTAVISKYQRMFGFSDTIVFNNLETLLANTQCDAVAAFNPISEHIKTVRLCAHRGVHVMVEKPLALNMKQAEEMQQLASENSIHLITNYETTWYPALQYVYKEVAKGSIGELTKLEINCGHSGPVGINVYPEFLEWLIDPAKNGGGALVDFGCYGANIATYFNKGKRPLTVTAIIANNKPDVYKQVEDEAIILLEYEAMQCVIQASWNWPFNRKDVEAYGQTGYYLALDKDTFAYRLSRKDKPKTEQAEVQNDYQENPYAYFSALIKGNIAEQGFEPSALPNNVIVVEILETAYKSARTGKTIKLD